MDGVLPIVNQHSPAELKIRLFRSLFRGREDVYARRFESRKTGKSGYAQAFSNEWVRGICEEPRIKCADCQHRRFLPVTDDVIRWHLSGEDDQREPFVAGVYPLLLDESCFFLALDFEWDAELCTASDDVRLHPVHKRGENPNLLEVAHASRLVHRLGE